jgi:RNA polymerase sigma-70 factor (ECF subfamily)
MLADVYDADDALQETVTRAWRHLAGFEPRAPFRAWLFRIATNVCLTTLTADTRRREREIPMTTDAEPLDEALSHVTLYAADARDVADDETLQLAFIAAGQMLPPRQRAVLLLRDVLDFSAREVASMMETTPQAVNSALQRAHAAVDRERMTGRLAHPHLPTSDVAERQLAQSFASAWQAADIDGLVLLLTEDALLTMPPEPLRVVGRDAVAGFLERGPFSDVERGFRAQVIRANDQPAIALYRQAAEGDAFAPYAILALACRGGEVASVTRFADPRLFPRLGLETLPTTHTDVKETR